VTPASADSLPSEAEVAPGSADMSASPTVSGQMTVVADEAPRAWARAPAVVSALFARWQVLLPAALTLVLAFRAGGFFYGTTALLAVVLALLLVARVTLGRTPFAGWSPALAAVAGALALLACWTLMSATWSDAPFRALSEFDRTLAYTLVVCLIGSFASRRGDLDQALRALTGVFALVAAAALVTRFFPDAFPTAAQGKEPSRLAFPLTYWNALGVWCAIGSVLALHCAAGARQGVATRLIGAGALPILATTLYLTFSRGGIAAAVAGLLAYAVLAVPRRLPVALVAAGIPTFIAVYAAYGADSLATDDFVAAQAADVALVVLLCSLGAMALRALGLLADRRLDAIVLTRRVRRTMLAGAAVAMCAALVVVAVGTDVPGRLDEKRQEFLHGGVTGPTGDRRDRFSELGANGRIEHWKVARRMVSAKPLTGDGAGTFRLAWERDRNTTMSVVDAHSLYLEMPAELGWPGLLLLAVALLGPLAVAVRRLVGPERHAHAAFLAAALALLLHAGIDWDWEMPVLFLWFVALGAMICAAPADKVRLRAEPGRLVRIVAGLACLLLVAAPATVVASQAALDRATAAFQDADCATAIDSSLDSLDALRSRPEPYELLGYCNLRARQFELGLAAMQAASRRDPDNWEYFYGIAIAQALSGQDPRPAAATALALNPRDYRARELSASLRRGGPRRWARAAAQARIPFQ
jgi:hypothetical protein